MKHTCLLLTVRVPCINVTYNKLILISPQNSNQSLSFTRSTFCHQEKPLLENLYKSFQFLFSFLFAQYSHHTYKLAFQKSKRHKPSVGMCNYSRCKQPIVFPNIFIPMGNHTQDTDPSFCTCNSVVYNHFTEIDGDKGKNNIKQNISEGLNYFV